MSALYFEREYQQALSDLADVQREDAYITTVHVPADAKGRNAFSLQFWLNIYARYMHIARRLSVIHDTKLQAQQLNDVRTLLDACLGRMLEAKAHLVADCGDYVPLDNAMLDLKRTPDELETPIPRYFREDRESALEEQRNRVAALQAHYLDTEDDAPVSAAQRLLSMKSDPTKALPPMATKKAVHESAAPTASSGATDAHDYNHNHNNHNNNNAATRNMEDDAYNEEQPAPMSINEAVQLLQVCERGRQARQRVRFQLSLFRQRRFAAEHGAEFSSVTGKDRAAAVVQAVVQGYLARKRAHERAARERQFLGMRVTAEAASDAEEAAARSRALERKARQRVNMAELKQRSWAMRDAITTQEGPKAMEEMLDEVAMHLAYARMQSGDAAIAAMEVPSADEGGSLALLQRLSRDGRGAENGQTTTGATAAAASRGKRAGRPAGKAAGAPSSSSSGGGGGGAAVTTSPSRAEAGNADEEVGEGGEKERATKTTMPSARPASAEDATGTMQKKGSVNSTPGSGPAAAPFGSSKKMANTLVEAGGDVGEKSARWTQMNQAMERYNTVWRDRFVSSYVEQKDWQQGTDVTLLREELLSGPRGILAELRRCVDELVLVEVNNLKERLRMEQGGGKPAKGAGGRGGRRKKKEGGGAVKKPKLKDPAKGVDVDTLMHTAVFENKLQLPPATVRIESLVGPESVVMSSLNAMTQEAAALPALPPSSSSSSSSSSSGIENEEIIRKWQRVLRGWNEEVEKALRMTRSELESRLAQYVRQTPTQRLVQCDVGGGSALPAASVAQLRRAVVEYGILPLGSQVIHDMLPTSSPRGLLFYGLPATGKTWAAFALCNEAGAHFFNLSPANFVVAKEVGKVVQLMLRLARLRAPSVIYMDQIEKVFVRRGAVRAKQAKRDPLLVRGKAIRKELLRGWRTLEPHDRVLLVATSTQPWEMDRAVLTEMFGHALYFALPNYATRQALLRHFIVQAMQESEEGRAGGFPAALAAAAATCTTAASTTSFSSAAATVRPLPLDLAALQQLTGLCNGLSAGQIRTVVRRTLSPWRVEQLAQMPLTVAEFVHVLSSLTPATEAEVARMAAFHDELPMHMRRALPATDFEPTEEELKNMTKKKKRKAVNTNVDATRAPSDKNGAS